ncbi:MAG: hypothetical protein JNL98_25925 [Bryobacterales bacterium]|nr:hypothetical protein [Bryobacterales bacterium]
MQDVTRICQVAPKNPLAEQMIPPGSGAVVTAPCHCWQSSGHKLRAHRAQTSGTDLIAEGWYIQAAKFIRPKLQAVVKVEGFDPNVSLLNGKDTRQTTLGLNYYLRKNRFKVMASYVVRQERIRPLANNVLQCQLQAFIH